MRLRADYAPLLLLDLDAANLLGDGYFKLDLVRWKALEAAMVAMLGLFESDYLLS